MQSKSGSKNYGRYISIGITVAIVMMMVLSGPVTAVSIGITELDGTTHTKGNSLTFNVTTTIEGTDRYVPIDSFSLEITGATSKEVVFSTDGNILSGSGMTVEAVTVPSSSEYGQGDGYGYDSKLGYGYDFGYGYGYGYDNGAGGEDVVYKYTITLDTSTFNAGVHEAILSLNTGDGAKPSFESSAASFTIESSSSSGGSSGGSSSGGGGGSGSTGEAFENIAFKAVKTENIVGGSAISYVFDDEQNAIQYINFFAVRNYQRTSTTIEVLKGRSAMVDESAPGLIYQNMNIWVGKSGFATEDNVADPVIGFRVAKDWLTENGIDEDSITLYHYSEGKWNALNTGKIGEDDSYIYFEAETPGFSPFAIAADVDDEVVADITPIEEDSSILIITEPSGEDVNATVSDEESGLGLKDLLFVIPVFMFFGLMYATYATAKKNEGNADNRTEDLPDDMQNAESDVSETALDSTNTEETPGQPAQTIPPVDEVSDQLADTIPTAEEILGYPGETISPANEVSDQPAETTSPAQENEVRPVDTEQNVKEMKKSRNFSDDGWSTSTTEEISGEPAQTTSTAEEYEVQLDDTEQEKKEPRNFHDDEW